MKTTRVVDLTPISEATIQYWADQGFTLEQVQDDQQYQEEILASNEEQIAQGKKMYNPEKFGPKDPSHPYAYTPRYVTYRMRRDQEFVCYVTGWHESEWIYNRQSGEVRQVGKLTRDHTKAASLGGETSAANLKMVCGLANRKKGHKSITYTELRKRIHEYWSLFEMDFQTQAAIAELQQKGVTYVTVRPT